MYSEYLYLLKSIPYRTNVAVYLHTRYIGYVGESITHYFNISYMTDHIPRTTFLSICYHCYITLSLLFSFRPSTCAKTAECCSPTGRWPRSIWVWWTKSSAIAIERCASTTDRWTLSFTRLKHYRGWATPDLPRNC